LGEDDMMKTIWRSGVAVLILGVAITGAQAAEPIKVLSAGAFKQVLIAILPQYETSERRVEVQTDTVGGLVRRIEAGETYDLVIASPAALGPLLAAGRLADPVRDIARVGVGVAVRAGAPKPDIATVDGFRNAVLKARAVAYIDPAAGGTSGIYVSGLLDRLGIGPEVKAKAILVKGGYSAERIVSGEADLAVQQISELLPVAGVDFVGPLPPEIQSFTVYSAGTAARTAQPSAVKDLVTMLTSPPGAAAIRSKGMEPAF